MTDLLLVHACLIPIDRDRRIIEDGAVAIAGDRIVEVGPTAELERRHEGARRLDCTGRAVIPGLIDAHGHAGHSLIKTLGADTPSLWMRIVTPLYFHYTTPEFWLADGYLSAVDRLRQGVTCGVSVVGSAPRSDDPSFAINHTRGYAAAGIREIVCTGPAGLPWPHPATRWQGNRPERHEVSFEEMLAGAEAVIETVNGTAEGRIQAFLTPFTIMPSVDPSNPTTPDRAVRSTEADRMQGRRIKEVAAKHGVRIHSDAFGGHVRMAWQDPESAILGPNVHLQHCIGLSLDEVEILAETGTHMAHAPGGQAPVIEMMARGVNVALTTDGAAPWASFDLFQAARQAQFAHRWRREDQYLLPPGKLLEMMTIDAARAIGREADLGSIEPGKKADITIVNLRQPHLTPNWMPVHRLVYEAVGQDVETVIVDGRIVLADGKPTLVDAADIMAEAERQSAALVARAGVADQLTPPGWGQVYRTFETPVRLTQPPEIRP
ncbi:MAG: amidohydrolase family protein [Candidatus Kaistia colombiensis]|nr:MAG: amidohydrolase family protein [Kaistia sp.]